jgi:hypothetical protein
MRKIKVPWTHFKKDPWSDVEMTPCGKSARRIVSTKYMNRVTCPRCIEALKIDNLYCPNHGFVEDYDVNENYKCGTCGEYLLG